MNNDNFIDIKDVGIIDVDVFNSVTGYVKSDLTGDYIVDIDDLSIVETNSYNFVTTVKP